MARGRGRGRGPPREVVPVVGRRSPSCSSSSSLSLSPERATPATDIPATGLVSGGGALPPDLLAGLAQLKARFPRTRCRPSTSC